MTGNINLRSVNELLLTAPGGYEVVEVEPDGKKHVYRGRDLTAFIERRDHRMHEHKVFDSAGALIYHRDRDGTVHVGNSQLWFKDFKKLKVKDKRLRARDDIGSTALQVVRDAVRRNKRMWLG